ncbi:MAG: hypothetical protein CMO74_03865 [Verrucomicrobiales bacterium]|nr:hypothetical protein [Verrucomicrobiales bacterium]|tara:strand:+ start:553 stop:1146 length:594 start_codon:yes stop_codon:yes gene_type:complete
MTTANKVTIARIMLVPFFVVELMYYLRTGDEMHRYLAVGAFLVAAISDGVDGWLARHRNQQTKLGTYLDPLADKLLLISGLILLSIKFENSPFGEPLPLWFVGAVLGRDLIVVSGSTLVYLATGDLKVQPHILSKISSVLQMVCISWVLLKMPSVMTFWLALGASVTTAVTGVMYVFDGIRQFAEHPAAHPELDDEN